MGWRHGLLGVHAPVLDWLEGISFRSHGAGTVFKAARSTTDAMVETLTAFRAAIAWQVALHQFNLIDSHDTARIRTVLGGDEGRVRAAFGLLLTYVGVPVDLLRRRGGSGRRGRDRRPTADALGCGGLGSGTC